MGEDKSNPHDLSFLPSPLHFATCCLIQLPDGPPGLEGEEKLHSTQTPSLPLFPFSSFTNSTSVPLPAAGQYWQLPSTVNKNIYCSFTGTSKLICFLMPGKGSKLCHKISRPLFMRHRSQHSCQELSWQSKMAFKVSQVLLMRSQSSNFFFAGGVVCFVIFFPLYLFKFHFFCNSEDFFLFVFLEIL